MEEDVTQFGTMRRSRPARFGFAVCVSVTMLCGVISPASADWFWRYDDGGYEQSAPPAAPAPKRHKPKRKITQEKKQSVPPGPLQIVVSIAKQRATLFANDVAVAEAPISTGVPGHPTPMGVFSVIAKSRYHSSNIYSGAPMPYMQRITWSGIALHQGPLPGFPASHGCIRLPEAFAVKLWGLSKLGMGVVITRDPVAPVRFADARLIVPKPPQDVTGTAMAAATDEVTAATGADKPADAPKSSDAPKQPDPPKQPVVRIKPIKPMHAFISRKQGKVYVRQGFEPVFDAPVTIAAPDQPWGTHVFTVTAIKDGKADWTALTIPSGYVQKPGKEKMSAKARERQEKRAADLANAPSAAQALARFELPPDASARIGELLTVGSSLIVSDNALSDETGSETGFIVLTP